MTRVIRPLADRVLVLPDGEVVKKGGLSVPKAQAEEPTEGVVVAAGELAEKVITYVGPGGSEYAGNLNGVAIGDRVQFPRFAGRKTMHNGREHRLLRLEEVEGVIEEVPE